jgi:hypothetical protein
LRLLTCVTESNVENDDGCAEKYDKEQAYGD